MLSQYFDTCRERGEGVGTFLFYYRHAQTECGVCEASYSIGAIRL
jgi:hypothetical protein